MARKRRHKRKTEHPSGRPEPNQPSHRKVAPRKPALRLPRLPGHGMR